MAILQVIRGLTPGQTFSVEGERAVLGRNPECDIVLEVAAISRQHASIVLDAGKYFLEDLGSRNGTFLNGQIIEGRQLLNEGDQVVICDLAFNFYLNEPSSELAGPMPTDESSMPLLVDDEPLQSSGSTVMTKIDLSSSRSILLLSAKPEVKLKAIIEIGRSLGKALSLEDVLSQLLDSLFKVFVQADRGFVVLQAADDGPLVPKAVKYRRSDDDRTVRISRTIIRQAMNGKEAILSADAATDERFGMAQSISDFHIRSLMCAPLIDSEGKALGIIQIDTLNQRSRFNEEDLEVLASVASQAAVAVENAQLHEQRLRQLAIERDLELAHRVQQGFLPSTSPQVAGYHFFHYYEPANQVGGDYYDYVLLPDGRIAVVVADVSGKGVAAALLMAKLASDVRYLLASEADPAAAVRRINDSFARPDWEDRFVTFVVAVLDPALHQLTVVNAGHMAPLLRRGPSDMVAIGEEEAGLPLGVVEEYEYQATAHTLYPGDFLTIFTDGISEAMNASGDLYGLEKLRRQIGVEAVSVEDLGQHILNDVRQFVGGRPQSDDMCLACFGRVEESS